MAILAPGTFEDQVRSKLGVFDEELPDADLNQPLIKGMAEAKTIKRVPNYENITDEVDELYLQNAVVAYICYLVCPSMPRRLNVEVSTLDTKWKKEKVDWDAMAMKFLSEFEDSLANITTVEVEQYTTKLVDIITHERETI